jgi:transposase
MLARKAKEFKQHVAISLEQLVPQNNFYRLLEGRLDLSFVCDLVKSCYAITKGRPSIDPVVFVKLQLIMFFEGIRSERQLMEMVDLNLAYRWYIGYDLDESVPNHSNLSKIRERYGLEVFQHFFPPKVCQTRKTYESSCRGGAPVPSPSNFFALAKRINGPAP